MKIRFSKLGLLLLVPLLFIPSNRRIRKPDSKQTGALNPQQSPG
jgi:hypothetical protein